MLNGNALLIVAALALLGIAPGRATAAYAIFHYVPAGPDGHMTLKPNDATGTAGVVVTLFGRRPYDCPPRPTCAVPLTHPCTSAKLLVPLDLPAGTPNIQHRYGVVIYNYGTYTVEVHFLEDGSLNVVYNSGLLRAVAPP